MDSRDNPDTIVRAVIDSRISNLSRIDRCFGANSN